MCFDPTCALVLENYHQKKSPCECIIIIAIVWDIIQGGTPQVISWFIIPLTIDISPINHSYWSYKPT